MTKYIILALALSGCAGGIQQDKVAHFGMGAATSIIVSEYTGSPVKGCVAALGVGLAKEYYDSRGHSTVEAADALATAAGCLLTFEWKF